MEQKISNINYLSDGIRKDSFENIHKTKKGTC